MGCSRQQVDVIYLEALTAWQCGKVSLRSSCRGGGCGQPQVSDASSWEHKQMAAQPDAPLLQCGKGMKSISRRVAIQARCSSVNCAALMCISVVLAGI